MLFLYYTKGRERRSKRTHGALLLLLLLRMGAAQKAGEAGRVIVLNGRVTVLH